MSAVATKYVYEVKLPRDGQRKPEPTVGREKIAEYKANVAKYLGKQNEREN